MSDIQPIPKPPLDPATLFNLDFDIMRENWSIYNLEDGNKLKMRVFLIQVRSPSIPPKKGDQIVFEFSQAVTVDAPPNRRGQKGHAATQEELSDPKNHGGVEISVESSREPWNEYHLAGTDRRLRVKIIVNRVWRIQDRFDAKGDPVYVINVTTLPVLEQS